MRNRQRFRAPARTAARAVFLGVSVGALGACDSLLEVDLPHILTVDAINDFSSAPVQVASAQSLYECGMSAFSWVAQGHEDVMESVAGVAGTVHVYRTDPVAGTCDTTQQSQAWFDQIMGTRLMISTDPAKLGNTGGTAATKGVYDQLTDPVNPWQALIVNGERLSATTAVYMAAALQHFSQYYCEGALDGGSMITGAQFGQLAEEWITNRALVHVTNVGDFAMPNGAATGTANTRNTAIALRAQIRLGRGDLAGANADAVTVLAASPSFAFNATRESGAQRRNKVYDSGTSAAFSGMLSVNTAWNGPTRSPNPATGLTWPTSLPFTGYIFLGIQPDGRTLEAANLPVRWANPSRTSATATPPEAPVSLNNGSVQDPRVPHFYKAIQGPSKREVPDKLTSGETDIPLVTWRELTLIRARFENEVNDNRAAAIALINGMRAGAPGCAPVSPVCVPDISGAHLTVLTNGLDDASIVGATDQQEMRMVIMEEARRELYSESGRYWAWKIQNTDIAWFPRFQGFIPSGVYRYQGGVRLNWPNEEYERNTNFPSGGRANRGIGCAAPTGTAALASVPFDISERPSN